MMPRESHSPRDDDRPGEALRSFASRAIGCAFLILPVTLFAGAKACGLVLGERVLPDGSIGHEPGRGTKILLAFAIAILGFVAGMRWLAGRPKDRAAELRHLLGAALLGVAAIRVGELDASTFLSLAGGIGLLVSSLWPFEIFGPPDDRSAPPPE